MGRPIEAENEEILRYNNGMASKLKIGRRVGGFLYLHRSGIDLLPEDEHSKLCAAELLASAGAWNLCKIGKDKVTLLTYEAFELAGFPALLQAVTVDLTEKQVKTTDYSKRANPPILHRKELLLPATDPRIPEYAALTRAAEQAGLFDNAKGIGNQKAWQERIDAAGLKLVGQSLHKREDG